MKKIFSYLFLAIIFLSCLFGIYYITSPQKKRQYNNFVNIPPSEGINLIDSKKQGVYYIGYPECPWCRELEPLLAEEISSSKKIYSINIHDKGFTKHAQFKLDKIYSEYYNDELTVPLLISINSKQEIITHVGTVPGHNAKINKLSKSEKERLIKKIRSLINWSSQ